MKQMQRGIRLSDDQLELVRGGYRLEDVTPQERETWYRLAADYEAAMGSYLYGGGATEAEMDHYLERLERFDEILHMKYDEGRTY